MNVLVCGAHGFIGSALCTWLERSGHRVVKGVRCAEKADDIAIDYTTDVDPEQWRARLKGIDAVVNAVGILVERGNQTFDAVHRRGPIALFEACSRVGVKRVIQISALGAQEGDTPYFTSKCAADAYLQTLPVSHHIVRPALVYGPRGASATFFRMLASVPVHFLPAGGHQLLRPIHIDDLAEVVVRLLDTAEADYQSIEVVGAEQVEYREMLAIYRKSLGLTSPLRVSIPAIAIDAGAALLNRVPGSMLNRDTWRMLKAGNTSDVAQTSAVLGRLPRGIQAFMRENAASLRREALEAWRPCMLRSALAVVWIGSAFVSAFFHPRSESLALLARVHLHGAAAIVALYLAATLDFAFGLATIFRPGRRLWIAQGLLITMYSTIVAIFIPEVISDPFGAILKNLPILAILLVLFSEEARP
ncbi:SDR family oxidoreductase [Trinickia fusca]|uniref:SDR family oxidoreductase n=1 Tax=Trinickia fusca TaxID=2419777 RepID=A0A494X6G9_9BURK|nr:SDR family oxidoreductase [Trinickia fusca]RKP46010.1 SDR family oxidoreductase [Trinickia fusca]